MSLRRFHRAIARVTGENMATISRMGFQPLRRRPFELDPEGYTADWDDVQAQRHVAMFPARTRQNAVA